jgi:hypothetical protein
MPLTLKTKLIEILILNGEKKCSLICSTRQIKVFNSGKINLNNFVQKRQFKLNLKQIFREINSSQMGPRL